MTADSLGFQVLRGYGGPGAGPGRKSSWTLWRAPLADLIGARNEGDPMVAIEEVRLLIQSCQVERRQDR